MKRIKLDIQLFGASASKTNTSLKSTAGNKGTLKASFTESDLTADNISNNTSTISASASFTQVTGSFSSFSKPYLRLYWYDNNKNKDGIEIAKLNVTSMSKGQTRTISATKTVEHLSDGTLKGYVKAKWEYDGSNTLPCQTGYAKTDETLLTTIPRASKITALNTDVGSSTIINIDKKSENFTTSISYKYFDLTGEIVSKSINNSVGWTIPTSFYNKIPNDKYGECELIATTYNGDTQVGEPQSTTIKVYVNEIDNKPTISTFNLKDINSTTLALTKNEKVVVLNASDILATFEVKTKNSSTIKSIYINDIQTTYETKDYTSTGTSTINKPQTNKFKIVATDSRGIIAEKEVSLEKIDYIIPDVNAIFKRNTPTDGLINLDFNGNFYNGNFSSNIQNDLKIYYSYKEKDGDYVDWINITEITLNENNTYSGSIQLSGIFDYEKIFNFKLSIEDKVTELGKIIYYQDIGKGRPSHWYDDENFYTEGNYYTRDKETGKWKKHISNELPIGSIYANLTDSRNPYEILGYGTWVAIKGRFLLGTGSPDNNTNDTFGSDLTYDGTNKYNFEAGVMGGESLHTLTSAQLASHTHNNGTYKINADFYIRHGNTSGTEIVASGTNTKITTGAYSSKWSNGFSTSTYSHKPDKVGIDANVTGSSSSVGENKGHSNMPPFVAVNMWYRAE